MSETQVKNGIVVHDPAYDADQVRSVLVMILESLGIAPTFDNFEDIAKRLSKLAGIDKPWTAKYVHSVYKGYKGCQASPAMGRAVMAWAETVDNVPVGVAGSEIVQVYAYPGQVPAGTVIPRSAQVISCARPGCIVKFIRVHPFQRYHDPECQKEWQKDRRKIEPKK